MCYQGKSAALNAAPTAEHHTDEPKSLNLKTPALLFPSREWKSVGWRVVAPACGLQR